MITLNTLGFDAFELGRAVKNGRVKMRPHPDHAAVQIFNYTEPTAFNRDWDAVTLQCRGLIVDFRNDPRGVVLARPLPKFFNYGEPGAAEIGLDEPVEVTDKLDGSLGILYRAPDGEYAIATRGSFTSTQAIAATEILREAYLDTDWIPVDGLTYLFEIILPENRIVVDYGTQRDLVLLGAVDNRSGAVFGPDVDRGRSTAVSPALMRRTWPGPRTENLTVDPDARERSAGTLREVLQRRPRPNAEGVVVRAGDRMVKVKQEDYVRLHRIVTGLNERAIWEHMGEHCYTAAELLREVPEEFHDFVVKTANDMTRRADDIEIVVREFYQNTLAVMRADPQSPAWDPKADRAAFAGFVRESKYTGLLFALLDGRDIRPMIWKTLRPKGELPEASRNQEA